MSESSYKNGTYTTEAYRDGWFGYVSHPLLPEWHSGRVDHFTLDELEAEIRALIDSLEAEESETGADK